MRPQELNNDEMKSTNGGTTIVNPQNEARFGAQAQMDVQVQATENGDSNANGLDLGVSGTAGGEIYATR